MPTIRVVVEDRFSTWSLGTRFNNILGSYELREKTVKKFSKRISAFIEEIAVPFEGLKVRDEMQKRLRSIKSKEEHTKLLKDIEEEVKELESGKDTSKSVAEIKATDYIVGSFLEHMAVDSRNDYKKAFKKPPDERYPKFKHRIDRISFTSRRHIFAIGCVFIFFSIFIEIISK